MLNKIIISIVFLASITISKVHSNEYELIDCSNCTTVSEARNLAHSNSRFRDSGIYPTVVLNTSTGLIEQFNVNVERESGISHVFSQTVSVDTNLNNAFNQWIARYGNKNTKDIVVYIDCPATQQRCNYGNGAGALFDDVQSYARGTPEVGAEINGLWNLITFAKMKVGKASFKVVVTFANGEVLL